MYVPACIHLEWLFNLSPDIDFQAFESAPTDPSFKRLGRLPFDPLDLERLISGRLSVWPGQLSPSTSARLLAFTELPHGALSTVCALLSELAGGATAFMSAHQSEATALTILQGRSDANNIGGPQNILSVLPTAGMNGPSRNPLHKSLRFFFS